MAFINLSLLIGGVFTAIPVVLHLVMRQRPKRLVFPALQFLRRRRETNRRTLKLRHWLLLALRCALLAILALALARPSVDSATVGGWLMSALLLGLLLVVAATITIAAVRRRGKLLLGVLATIVVVLLALMVTQTVANLRRGTGVLLGDQRAPVAAALVIDTSPAMLYRYQNQTRLEVAQQTATWLIGQLPLESEVAIVESRPGPAVFSVDLATAAKAVARLETSGISEPLPDAIRRALPLLSASDKVRKEMYVFTDLTRSAFPGEDGTTLQAQLAAAEDVILYVIDVGVEQPRNTALGDLQLSREALAGDNELVVETELRVLGAGGSRSVELLVEQPDPQRPVVVDGQMLLPDAVRRDRQTIELEDDGGQRVRFRVRGLPPGLQHGSVRIDGADNLAVDDVRHFAVEVKEAWPVLVVAPRGVVTSLLTEAIAPFAFRQTRRARFEPTVIGQADLANQELDGFAVVCLLDPEPLTPPHWQRLARYVRDGGGLAIFLGHNAASTASFHVEEARPLIGGRLARTWRAGDRELYLAPQQYDHPILAPFREQATSVPWNLAPVFRHWVLEELAAETTVVLRLGNGKPAIVESTLGAGRVLVMTTPVSDPAQPAGRGSWNELPTSEVAWPYIVLVNEMMLYLADSGDSRLNYTTGETATLVNDSDRHPPRYELFPPRGEPLDVTTYDGQIIVRFTDHAGPYRLKGDRGGPVLRGFAVNLPPRISDLRRLTRAQLDEILGPGRYQFARNRDEIVMEVGQARVGQEFYPYLMALAAFVFSLEYLLSNRFYRKTE